MSRTFNLTDLAKAMPKFSARNYDILDHADRIFTTPFMHARMASSMAWMLDNTLVNTARSLFWRMYETMSRDGLVQTYDEFLDKMNGASIDAFNDLLSTLSSVDDSAHDLDETGREAHSLVETVDILMVLRNTFHDRAFDHNGGTVGRARFGRHNVPSLERLFIDIREMPISTDTKEKQLVRAKKRATNPETGVIDVDLMERYYAAIARVAQAKSRDNLEAMKKRIPAMLNIVNTIRTGYHPVKVQGMPNEARTTAEFNDLPKDVRRRYLEVLTTLIDSAVVAAEGNRAVTALDYEDVYDEAVRAKLSIEQVLKEPELADDDPLASLTTMDSMRREIEAKQAKDRSAAKPREAGHPLGGTTPAEQPTPVEAKADKPVKGKGFSALKEMFLGTDDAANEGTPKQ